MQVSDRDTLPGRASESRAPKTRPVTQTPPPASTISNRGAQTRIDVLCLPRGGRESRPFEHKTGSISVYLSASVQFPVMSLDLPPRGSIDRIFLPDTILPDIQSSLQPNYGKAGLTLWANRVEASSSLSIPPTVRSSGWSAKSIETVAPFLSRGHALAPHYTFLESIPCEDCDLGLGLHPWYPIETSRGPRRRVYAQSIVPNHHGPFYHSH